jgi:DNA-binding CsgD family transcriptional regulator
MRRDRAIMDSIAPPSWVERIGVPAWITASNRKIVYMNAHAETLLGHEAVKCVGRLCYEVFGGHTRVRLGAEGSEPLCGVHCPVQHAVRQGRELPPFEVRVVTSGKEQWIHLLPILVRDEEGETWIVHCAIPADKQRRLETYIGQVAGRSPHPPCPACLSGLSPRELEVLRLLAEDLTLGDIAERLGVSYATVRNHVQHVLVKVSAHSTAEAIAVYLLGEADDQKSTANPKRCVSPSASGSKR